MNDDFYLGRSCPTEPVTDPQTGAKLCELPNTVAPQAGQTIQPTTSPQATHIARVGGEATIFWALMLTAFILAGIALYDNWKNKK